MDQCRVLGVVQWTDGNAKPDLQYLNEHLPATPEVLAQAAPLKATEVFRLAATCQERLCPHFDGSDCRLATRIVRLMPAAVDVLPPCIIRKECRWYFQEGEKACKRCPAITTVSHDLSEQALEIAGLPIMED
jgi:hypothetical protein